MGYKLLTVVLQKETRTSETENEMWKVIEHAETNGWKVTDSYVDGDDDVDLDDAPEDD